MSPKSKTRPAAKAKRIGNASRETQRRASTHSRRARATALGLILAVAVLALSTALMAFAGRASAAEPGAVRVMSAPAAVPMMVPPNDSNTKALGVCGSDSSDKSLLPVERWGDSMGLHTRLGGILSGDVGNQVNNSIEGVFLSFGNTAFRIATSLTEWSTNFCPIGRVGGMVDAAFAKVGTAVLHSTLLAMLLSITILGLLFRQMRNVGAEGFMRALFAKALVAAVLVIMVVGASNSTGGGAGSNPDAMYKPGAGSPGWYVTTVDNLIGQVAGSIVDSMDFSSNDPNQTPVTNSLSPSLNEGDQQFDCAAYVRAMHTAYRNSAGVAAGTNSDVEGLPAQAAIPLALNDLWESSGLQAWKDIQYGANSNYSEQTYCRQLEWQAGTRWTTPGDVRTDASGFPGTIKGLLIGAGVPNALAVPSAAWKGSTSNTYEDRILVGLAACVHINGKWTIPNDRVGLFPNNSTLLSNGESPDQACADLYSNLNHNPGADNNYNDFDWESGSGKVGDHAATTDGNYSDTSHMVQSYDADFLKSLHGANSNAGWGATLAYLVSSISILFVFGLMSLGVIFAKISALVMMFGVIGALVYSQLPNSDHGKIVEYGRRYIGISIFSLGASLLFALVTLFTKILTQAGQQFIPGGAGGFFSMLWVGISPAIAMYAMHRMFKKMGLPSPLSVTGAQQYAHGMATGNLSTVKTIAGMEMLQGLRDRAAAQGRASARSGLDRLNPLSNKKGRSGNTQADANGSGKMGPASGNTANGAGDSKNGPATAAAEGAQASAEDAATTGTGGADASNKAEPQAEGTVVDPKTQKALDGEVEPSSSPVGLPAHGDIPGATLVPPAGSEEATGTLVPEVMDPAAEESLNREIDDSTRRAEQARRRAEDLEARAADERYVGQNARAARQEQNKGRARQQTAAAVKKVATSPVTRKVAAAGLGVGAVALTGGAAVVPIAAAWGAGKGVKRAVRSEAGQRVTSAGRGAARATTGAARWVAEVSDRAELGRQAVRDDLRRQAAEAAAEAQAAEARAQQSQQALDAARAAEAARREQAEAAAVEQTRADHAAAPVGMD